jgi:hypothetical protein
MKTIRNPKSSEMKIQATCVIISRKPKDQGCEFKTAMLGIYEDNNPHKKNLFPKVIYEFSNIEKIRLKNLNMSYYLEGNDLVINDLEELFLIHEENLLILKGYQFEVEKRKKKK